MKGLIFNIAEEIVVDLFDEDTWDQLLETAGIDGAYTAIGNYSDGELLAIISRLADTLGQTTDEVFRTVGRLALPKLSARLTGDVRPIGGAQKFLMSVNDIIHPEVRMLYPESTPPIFVFEEVDEDVLEVVYRSQRRLDALAEGLILGCGDLFGQEIRVDLGARDGLADDEARFRVWFGGVVNE
jgi:hypothetical protein